METGIEFDVPVGEMGTLGKVDDTLEEGATWGNHPACKLECLLGIEVLRGWLIF